MINQAVLMKMWLNYTQNKSVIATYPNLKRKLCEMFVPFSLHLSPNNLEMDTNHLEHVVLLFQLLMDIRHVINGLCIDKLSDFPPFSTNACSQMIQQMVLITANNFEQTTKVYDIIARTLPEMITCFLQFRYKLLSSVVHKGQRNPKNMAMITEKINKMEIDRVEKSTMEGLLLELHSMKSKINISANAENIFKSALITLNGNWNSQQISLYAQLCLKNLAKRLLEASACVDERMGQRFALINQSDLAKTMRYVTQCIQQFHQSGDYLKQKIQSTYPELLCNSERQ